MRNIFYKIIILCSICFLTQQLSFSQTPAGYLTILQQPCNFDGIVVATVTSGMTPPLTFYYYNHQDIFHTQDNAMSDTLFDTQWVVFVYVSDNFGHYLMLSPTTPPPFTVDETITTPAICPNPGSATVTVNNGTMPDSVIWFNYNYMLPTPPAYYGSGNPMNLPAGSYYAIVYHNGCAISDGQDSGIFVENISGMIYDVQTTPANCTNGTATVINIVGGTAPYSYLWENGQTSSSIGGLSQGTYTVTVTDAQGCYKDITYGINQVVQITTNPVITNATCLNNDGSAICFASGGTPPYTYSYSNGASGQSICCLTGGTQLSVFITDIHGCTGVGYIYINSTTPIAVTYTSTSSSCITPTGNAHLIINGGTSPYNVSWDTYPPQTGVSVSGLSPGQYHFNVTDAVGCVRNGTVVIHSLGTINATVVASPAVCPSNTGSVSLGISGTNGPFSCLWNNGMTTPIIQNQPAGNYSCVITDNIGCKLTKNAVINQVSNLAIGINSTVASCMYASDGSISANAWGGTPPYTFNWSNGQSGNTISGLASGNYNVVMHDATGCMVSKFCNLGYNQTATSCYCTIRGTVFHDLNGNCLKDAGEPGINHIQVHCTGFGYTFTDSSGVYSFKVPTGNYFVSETIQNIYPLASCQTNNIPVNVTASSGCEEIVNFANMLNPIHDVGIVTINTNCAVPGNLFIQKLVVTNEGTLSEPNIQLGYKHDGQLAYAGSSPNLLVQQNPANNPNWYSITNNFPVLAPGASAIITNQFMVPTNIPLSTTVDFYDTCVNAAPMSNWLNDYTPWTNLNHVQAVVIGSFDPNFKEVVPAGNGHAGYIGRSDSILNYTIHFQNTGSYQTNKVVVVDTLDTDLNILSIRPGYSTHNYDVFLTEDRVLKFTFNNIILYPQHENEFLSKGFVTFSIKINTGADYGTVIRNASDIYFDYNEPVKTNTTINTIVPNPGIEEPKNQSQILVYPNPASSTLNVDTRSFNDPEVLNIYDINGRKVVCNPVVKSTIQTIDISGLPAGIYAIQLLY